MLSEIKSKGNLTVETATSVLNATHQNLPYKTLYSTLYDLRNLRIYLYYDSGFDTPHVLDVKKELAQTTGHRKISLEDLISHWNENKTQE